MSLGRKFHVESESEVRFSPIRRPDPENEEKLPPDLFFFRLSVCLSIYLFSYFSLGGDRPVSVSGRAGGRAGPHETSASSACTWELLSQKATRLRQTLGYAPRPGAHFQGKNREIDR